MARSQYGRKFNHDYDLTGASFLPLLRRLIMVFAVAAFLAFQLYALILPLAYVVAQTVYTNPATGFELFSGELLRELIRGVFAGLGIGVGPEALIILVAGVIVAGTGFFVLLQRQWALTLALVMPGIMNAAFLIATGLTFSPRFFLLFLPLSIIVSIQGVHTLAKLGGRILRRRQNVFLPRLATAALVVLVCAISFSSLRYYYSVPKQAYRASIQYLEAERNPSEIVIVVDIAEKGYRYYSRRLGIEEDEYFFVRSSEALEAVVSSHSENRSFLVTTFPRALHIRYPDLESRILEDWEIVRTFPATIGNGQISVWAQIQP